MTDSRPPRGLDDERSLLLAMLRYHRASLVAKSDGIDTERARWSPVESGTSILWLLDHATFVDHIWFEVRFAGRGEIGAPPESGSIQEARTRCIESFEAVERSIATSGLDEMCLGDAGGEPVDLRWILTHLIGETARHAGHADIIREMIDGSIGR